LIESASAGWHSASIWGSLLLGCSCLAAFFWLESRTASPMVPLELFHSRDFRGANLLTLFLYAALGIFFFLFPLNLIQVQHYSAVSTGAAALPLILLMFLLSRWSGGLVARYGAKRPLVLGPVIAAAGFLLFALPSVGGSYWRMFFPAFVVLGFGLAISVAPLTTVIMNSVDQKRAGTASGINNAVARIAGLLSIAALGVVMLSAFSAHLNRSLNTLTIPQAATFELQSHEIDLGALAVPADVDSGTGAAIKLSIEQAFVFAFRVVMIICAALSIVGAFFAWKIVSAAMPTRN
jgi:MFS family permease